jgi:hypothetical protein
MNHDGQYYDGDAKSEKAIEEGQKQSMMRILLDVQKEYQQSNRMKDKIIILLIVLMFLEAVAGYSGFVWYESQFETTTTETMEVYTEGDNANAEYVDGDQYNDNSVHNE